MKPPMMVRRSLIALASAAALTGGLLYATAAPVSAGTTATWVGTATVAPPNSRSALASQTSCASPGTCVSAGLYDVGTSTQPFATFQSDGTWGAVQLPLPGDAALDPLFYVSGLSCPVVGFCVAVGSYFTTTGNTLGFIDTGWDASWTTMAAPLPSGAATTNTNDRLGSVACAGAGMCVVAGGYHDLAQLSQGVAIMLAGGAWSATEVSAPANANANPYGSLETAACAAPGACVLGGAYLDSSDNDQGLVVTLANGAWVAAEAPLPPGAAANPDTELEAAACATVGSCTLVGAYQDAHGTQAMIEADNGGTLTAIEAPLPSDAEVTGPSPTPYAILASVVCPSAASCLAVGGYTTAGSNSITAPLAETYAGGTWAPSVLPEGPGTEGTFAQSVSCSWPGSCAVVGSSDGLTTATAMTWNLTNSAWTGAPGVLPPGVTSSLSAFGGGEQASVVSCVAGTCAVGGSYTDVSNTAGFIDTFPNLTGYQMVAADGGLFAFNTPFFGSMGGQPLNQPVVGMAVVPDSGGYYEVASDGGIFAFNAPFYGSMGGMPLNKPIVGIAFDTLTGGYYEVASDGGIFAFNAPFLGSMGGQPLNKPIVGIAFDPATGGYYEVASDGGIFAFGAPFLGSTGNITLNQPVVAMTVDTTTGGYYEVASDGGIFAYGAPFLGSQGGSPLNKPVVGMAFDYVTSGYYEVATDGGIFAFGAPFQGSTGNITLNQPVVGMAFG